MSHVISHLTLFPVIFTIPPAQLSQNYPNIKMRLCQRVGPAIFLHISLSHLQRVCPWELDNFSVSRQELLQSFSPFYFAAPSDIGQCVCTRPRTESFLISALFKGEFSAHFIQIFRPSERHHHRLVRWFLLQNSAIPSSRDILPYIHTWFVGWH